MTLHTVIAEKKPEQIEFSLIELIRQVVRGKYIVLATTVLGLIVGIAVGRLWKPWYFSQSSFLPPRYTDLTSGSPSALLLGGGSDASDLYLGLLASRSVQDDVVDHVGLKDIYHVPSQAGARFLLSKNSTFGVGRNALVFVSVKSSDPQLAARIANAYLDALYRLNGQMVASSSDARRIFFEQQLNDQRAILTKAEDALRDTQQRTGMVLPGGEAQAQVNATAQIQAQIGAAEERLAGLLVGATDQNPQVIQARAQLAQLRGELSRIQADDSRGSGLPSNSQLPGLTLEVEEKEREVKQAETSYETLLAQYAKARLASIDPGPQLEVVDRAVPAELPAGPDRRNLMMYGVGLGLLAGLLYVLFFNPLRRVLAAVSADEARLAR